MRNYSFDCTVCLVILGFLILIAGCTEKYPVTQDGQNLAKGSSCVSCHMDEELLKQVATPLPPPTEDPGEG